MTQLRSASSFPARRILDKLDDYLSRREFDAAERHLKYWLAEAELMNDKHAMLTMVNEQIGFYRKQNREAEALAACDRALKLAEETEHHHSVTLATTLINAATAYKAFGMAEKALPLYEEAREIYEEHLYPEDGRLGGLYNNMALSLMDLSRWQEARELFEKALEVMALRPGQKPEQAVTCCNLADLAAAEKGVEEGESEIGAWLEKAMELLDSPENIRDGNYAFVCEKCAPCFGYHGYFLYKKELEKRSEEIYERA